MLTNYSINLHRAGLIKALARCCLLWLLTVWQLPGLADPGEVSSDPHDHISARAWLDDPASSLGPDQVRAMGWTPYSGPLRRGFIASTTWLRLRVEPLARESLHSADRQTRLVLRMQPGHLNEIALFDPRYPDQPPQLAGDRQDWRLSEYRSFNQNLVLAAPSEPIEILLRLRTTSHHGIHVEALHWDEAEAVDRQQQLVMGAVIAFLLMVLAWAVAAWTGSRERVVGAFIAHQVVSVLFALSLFGFFRVYLSGWLPAPAIDQITSMLFPITTATVLWFNWHFLREFKPPLLAMRCLLLLAVASLLSLPIMLAGLMREALKFNSVIALLYPTLLLLLAWLSANPAPGDPPRLLRLQLVLIYSPMALFLWAAAMPALGWLPSPPWAMYSAIAYGLISAAILFGALRYRAMHAASASQKVLSDLKMAELLVDQERKRRSEQEQFMTMLTHELTNALATAQLAIGSLDASSTMRGRGYRAIDSMRDIIRRCSLSGAIEAADPALQVSGVNIPNLLHELRDQMPAGAGIALTMEAALPDCATDRQLLAVILGNLFDNALKYRADASIVEVTAGPQSRDGLTGLQVSISNKPGDAGRPDPEHLFKKYWRGPFATHSAGSGLGLYLSSLIAHRLGGELRYQPETSDVRFVLWLPI